MEIQKPKNFNFLEKSCVKQWKKKLNNEKL